MSNNRFIYVFSEKAKDVLLKAGYTMVSEDKRGSTFVFVAGSGMDFALSEVSYILSDKLSF